ncbi:MAG TPA: DUF6776 family protein [Cellvibrionaceae bacterium]
MVTVKGSKQNNLKVVPYRPVRQVLFFFLGVILIAAAIVGSFYVGQWSGVDGQHSALIERDQLRAERVKLLSEVDSLSQQVVNLSLAAEVDKQASAEVRTEVMDLKQQIAGLEADISLYRGLMAPGEDERGLQIGEVNISATSVPNRYRYKLVVQQSATEHQVLNGALKVDVIGRRDGGLIRVPLYQLSEEHESEDILLRFRYFQNVEGELVVPEGFTPERMELIATSTGANAARVEKTVNWQI